MKDKINKNLLKYNLKDFCESLAKFDEFMIFGGFVRDYLLSKIWKSFLEKMGICFQFRIFQTFSKKAFIKNREQFMHNSSFVRLVENIILNKKENLEFNKQETLNEKN